MSQRTRHFRVCLLTNVPTPNRLPVFEALAEHIDLTVNFCQVRDPARRWRTELRSDRVHYRVLAARTVTVPGNIELVWNPDLWARLQETPYDVYIAGENFTNFLSVLTLWRAARRWKRPFVLWSESIDTLFASGNFLSNMYRRWLYPRTDAFIAYGERPKQYLIRRGARASRIVLGLQVVPAEQLPLPAIGKADLGLVGKTVVLSMCYLVARKGVKYLIQAFRAAARENDMLVLAGSGPEEARLRQLSEGDARIFFPGYLDDVAKSNWYAAGDVFVLPTLHDPWAVAVNEAMAFGLPIIATDAAGCVPDIVRDQDNGLVIPPADAGALATALKRLLDDVDLRRRMGQRSRELIAGYTTQAACERFLQVIDLAERVQ